MPPEAISSVTKPLHQPARHSLLAEQLALHLPDLSQPSDGLTSFLAAVDESYRQADEGRRFEQQLIHLANHDPLTGLYNRRRFQDELEHELSLANADSAPGALLFLDVDQFKDVNDSLVTALVTSYYKASPSCCKPACAKTMSWHAPAGTSSACCCPTLTRSRLGSWRRRSKMPCATTPSCWSGAP
jgi:hypothetical protein